MEKMVNEQLEQQLQDVFKELENPVEIIYFGQKDDCEYCDQTRQLLEEVTGISDLLSLRVYDLAEDEVIAGQYKIDKAPGFTIAARVADQAVDYGIRYAGIPAGHEFTSLINDLVMVSRRDSGLSKAARDFLADLKEPVHLQVFVTPT